MGQLSMKLTHYTPTGATGIEPAISGLTGRRVNHYTTPPLFNGREWYQMYLPVSTILRRPFANDFQRFFAPFRHVQNFMCNANRFLSCDALPPRKRPFRRPSSCRIVELPSAAAR